MDISFIRKNISIIIVVCAALSASLILATSLSNYTVQKASKQFITALVEGDKPEQYCTGEVLFRVKTREIAKAEVLSISTVVIDKNKKFSRVYTEAKMLLPDKNIDVGFYEIDLIRDTEWKVFALRETMPKVNVGVPKSNLQELISDTYREYFEKISQNDSSCLAGPARTAFEKQPQKIALTGTISNLQTEIIFSGSKLILARHDYRYDSRSISVLVQYYLTEQGYKVVAVQSLGGGTN